MDVQFYLASSKQSFSNYLHHSIRRLCHPYFPLALSAPCPSSEPPSYSDIDSQPGFGDSADSIIYTTIPARSAVAAIHPDVAGILGVPTRWHIPLQICRSLSTLPPLWWWLRCSLTFLGELLFTKGGDFNADPWDTEKRFRVTEVFLAILWVFQASCSARVELHAR